MEQDNKEIENKNTKEIVKKDYKMSPALLIGGGVLLAVIFFLAGRVTLHQNRFNTKMVFDREINQTDSNISQPQMMRRGMMSGEGRMARGHRGGFAGEVTKIDGNNLTVKINNGEYTVVVADSTSFEKADNISKLSDLKVGDTISVMGSSNSQGQINAVVIMIQ